MLAILKGCSSIGALFVLVAGLAMTGVGIYGYLNPQIFLNETSGRNIILSVLIGSNVFIIIAAILGLVGIKKGNLCLIGIFQIVVIIFMLVFIVLGIIFQVLPNKFFDGDCKNSGNEVIVIANDLYVASTENFCQQKCPCNLTDSEIADNKDYSDDEKYTLLENYTRADNGSLKTQDCLDLNQSQKNVAQALGELEKIFSCSKWCPGEKENLIYRFSNVKDGKPNGYCYDIMKENVDKFSNILGLSCFGVAVVLFVLFCCMICICCHPQRRKMSLRDRFMMYDRGNYIRVG